VQKAKGSTTENIDRYVTGSDPAGTVPGDWLGGKKKRWKGRPGRDGGKNSGKLGLSWGMGCGGSEPKVASGNLERERGGKGEKLKCEADDVKSVPHEV